jgi:hypothetical protein
VAMLFAEDPQAVEQRLGRARARVRVRVSG